MVVFCDKRREIDDASTWKARYIDVKEKTVKQIYFTQSAKQ